jgi:hypothetical protein
MPNKKINELTSKTPTLTDLIIVGDPTSGYSYKTTLNALNLLVSNNTSLNNLNDVLITSASSGQVLSYDGANWVNITPTTWNTAYDRSLVSASVSGSTTKTLTLTKQDGSTLTASWTDINTDAVTSVFGRTGAIVATNGDYNTDLITEGSSNLYFTNSRSRSSISLTTIGTSGAATYNSSTGVLNIPSYVGGVTSVFGRTGAVVATEGDYNLGQLGDVAINSPSNGQVLSYNGTSWINAAATGGINSINGLTASTQTFATGTSGTDFAIVSSASTHTFNLPTASATNRGALSSADWSTFNSKIGGSGTTNYVPLFTGTSTIGNSVIYQDASGNVGFNLTNPTAYTNWRSISVNGTTGGVFSIFSNGTQRAEFRSSTFQANISTESIPLVLGVNSSSAIRIFSNNNVGINITDAIDSGHNFQVSGTVSFRNISNATTDTDRFLVSDSGVIKYRTGSELLSDIGGLSAAIISLNGLTTGTQTFAVGTSGTDFTISSTTSTHTFNLPTASATNRGALSSTDWSTFNNKQDTISLTTTGNSGSATFISNTLNIPTYTLAGLGGQPQLNGTGFVKISGTTISYDNSTYYLASNPSGYITLSSLSASAPLSYNNTTGAFSISQSSGSSDGYLSSSDWTTFNNKENAISAGTTSQYWRGDKSFQTLDTLAVTENTNLYFTNSRARQSISLTTTGTSGAATYDNTTGVLNIPQYSGGGGGGADLGIVYVASLKGLNYLSVY